MTVSHSNWKEQLEVWADGEYVEASTDEVADFIESLLQAREKEIVTAIEKLNIKTEFPNHEFSGHTIAGFDLAKDSVINLITKDK